MPLQAPSSRQPEGGSLHRVEALRERLRAEGLGGSLQPASLLEGRSRSDGEGHPEGLRPGSLGAITGPRSSGKTSLALEAVAAATRAGRLAAVLDGTGRLFPTALALQGIDLGRVLILRATASRAVWAAEQVLSSTAFSAVLLVEPGPLSRAALRRLQLAAERSGARALIVTSGAEPAPGLVAARLRAEPVPPLRESRQGPDERSPVASPPRRCRTRFSCRGQGAPRTSEVVLGGVVPSDELESGPRR